MQGLKYIFLVILFYLAYCCFMLLVQRQILFPRYLIPAPPQIDDETAGLEKIWIETEFGKVESWLMHPSPGQTTKPAPAVIFGHGNGELIDFWPEDLRPFTRLGWALILVEYPGYGRSSGSPSQQSITATFVAAYDALTARKDIDATRIIFFGRSLGGAAVCALAAKRPSMALILMSSFTSVRAFAKRYLVPSFFVRDPFDNLSVVKTYPEPILIIHGQHDNVIPFSHGVNLNKAAKRGQLIAYEAGHNDCPPDWDQFWRDITVFLQEAGVSDH